MTNSAGTQAPTKRKTGLVKIGDKVICRVAESPWYKVGQVYDVVAHPKSGLTSVPVSYTHLPSPRDKRQSRMPSSA